MVDTQKGPLIPEKEDWMHRGDGDGVPPFISEGGRQVTVGRVSPLRSRERGTWILTGERESVLGGALHLVAAALCWTPKVRTWMLRQEGKGRAAATVWIPWMTECPLWMGALTSVPLAAEGPVTSPSATVLG